MEDAPNRWSPLIRISVGGIGVGKDDLIFPFSASATHLDLAREGKKYTFGAYIRMKRRNVYESVSTLNVYKNADGTRKTHRVYIDGNKGFKQVTITRRGKTQKKRKELTKSEINCIRRCKFKKNLFSDCLPECV
jgi:hypothetical protein